MSLSTLLKLSKTSLLGLYFIQSIGVSSAWALGYEELYQSAPHSYTDPSVSQRPATPAAVAPQISISHDRANEIRSLMAEYIAMKINTLEVLQAKDDYTQMKELLGSYCSAAELSSNDKMDDCAERFIQMQRPILYKLKRGMDESTDAQVRLTCTRNQSDGNCVQQGGAHAIQANTDPLNLPKDSLPYLPSFADLQHFTHTHPQLKQVTPAEYSEWVRHAFAVSDQDDWFKHNVGSAPNREDFLKTKNLYRDPLRPDLGSTTEIVKDASGHAIYEEDRYKRAMKEYEDSKAAILASIPKSRSESELNSVRTEFLKPTAETELSAIIYNQARGRLVDEANHLSASSRPVGKNANSRTSPGTKTPSPIPSNALPNSQSQVPGQPVGNPGQQSPNQPASQSGNLSNPTSPADLDHLKKYTGKEKIDSIKYQNGQRGNSQNSVTYDSNNYSVDSVLGPIDVTPNPP